MGRGGVLLTNKKPKTYHIMQGREPEHLADSVVDGVEIGIAIGEKLEDTMFELWIIVNKLETKNADRTSFVFSGECRDPTSGDFVRFQAISLAEEPHTGEITMFYD